MQTRRKFMSMLAAFVGAIPFFGKKAKGATLADKSVVSFPVRYTVGASALPSFVTLSITIAQLHEALRAYTIDKNWNGKGDVCLFSGDSPEGPIVNVVLPREQIDAWKKTIEPWPNNFLHATDDRARVQLFGKF